MNCSRFPSRKAAENHLIQVYEHVKSLLGNNDCIKCLQDGDDFILTNCSAHLLRDLDITHPFYHLLNTAIQKHHDVYRAGTTTLVFLTTRLYQMALELQEKGIPTTSIISGLQMGILKCISNLDTVAMETIINSDVHSATTHECQPEVSSNRYCSKQHQELNDTSKFYSGGSKWINIDAGDARSQNSQSNSCEWASSVEVGSNKKLITGNTFKCSESKNDASGTLSRNVDNVGSEVSDKDLFDAFEVELKSTVENNPDPRNNVLQGESRSPLHFNVVSDLDSVDNDDISWYFHDGVVPETPDIDDDIKEALSEMTGILERKLIGKSNHVNPWNMQRSISDTVKTKNLELDLGVEPAVKTFNVTTQDGCNGYAGKNTHVNFHSKQVHENNVSSICDNVSSDDEFDSCFDDIHCKGTVANDKNMAVGSCQDRFQNIDDEFESCFEDIQYQDSLTNETNETVCEPHSDAVNVDLTFGCASSTKLCENLTSKDPCDQIFDESALQNNLTSSKSSNESSSETSVNPDPKRTNDTNNMPLSNFDLENKLNEILSRNKPKVGAKVMNRSRYFKTVESTVDELNAGNCDNVSITNEESAIAKESVATSISINNEIESSVSVSTRDSTGSDTQKPTDIMMNLNKLLCQKTKTIGSSILNRSRHFRTIESSVTELKDRGLRVQDEIQGDSNCTVCDNMAHVCDKQDGSQAKCDISEEKKTDALHSMSVQEEDSEMPPVPSMELNTESVISKPDVQSMIFSDGPSPDLKSRCYASEPIGLIPSYSGRSWTSSCETGDGWRHLVYGLCQGCCDVAPLVLEVAQTQSQRHSSGLLLHNIHTLCVPGPLWHRSCVVPGAVVMATQEQLHLVEKHKNKKWNILLLNGDLTFNYRHIGYNAPKNMRVSKKILTEDDRLELWTQNILSIIKEGPVNSLWLNDTIWRHPSRSTLAQVMACYLMVPSYHLDHCKLKVDSILVRGKVESTLVEACLGHQVSVVSGVPGRVLSSLAECGVVELNNYIVDVIESDVLCGVSLSAWRSDWSASWGDRHAFLKIEPPGALMQTAVICHPSKHLTHIREDQFWHSIYSVHHTLQSHQLVAGGGTTEASCATKLRQWADEMLNNDRDLFHSEVYRDMAEVFQIYADTIKYNQCHSSFRCNDNSSSVPSENYGFTLVTDSKDFDEKKDSSGERKPNYLIDHQSMYLYVDSYRYSVYDAFVPKVEAWKNAVHVVSLLINTDFEIITGLREDRNEEDFDVIL